LMSSDWAAFAETRHPDLPLQLLQRIETSDPALTKLEVQYKKNFKEAGCRLLARALSLNTCITSLDLGYTSVGGDGAFFLFPALTHLTGMTRLRFHGTGLESSGASHLCSALTHLTAMTELFLSGNNLTADDGARICGAAAAAGMTSLKTLDLGDNSFTASVVVGCGTWKQLNLPQPPDEVINKIKRNFLPLVLYLLSDDKLPCYSIRIFVVGESTVHSSPYSPAFVVQTWPAYFCL
jgi:hypothetical protein